MDGLFRRNTSLARDTFPAGFVGARCWTRPLLEEKCGGACAADSVFMPRADGDERNTLLVRANGLSDGAAAVLSICGRSAVGG